MTDGETVVEKVGRASIPSRFTPNLRLFLARAGYESIPWNLFGWLTITSILIPVTTLPLVVSLLFSAGAVWGTLLSTFYVAFGIAICYAVIFGGSAFFYNMRIYRRVQEIEEQLPEILISTRT